MTDIPGEKNLKFEREREREREKQIFALQMCFIRNCSSQ